MNKNMNRIGVLILIILFLIFYIVTTFFLERRNISKDIPIKEEIVTPDNNFDYEKDIVNSLYNDVKILYDVVNNKYIVSQDDTITIGNIIYKRIINFDDVTNNLFTDNGKRKYINDLNNYFAYTDNNYYLAGNLVSYQTYYFRGDETNIYILNSSSSQIDGIIYEKWRANNKNTLATIKVVNEEGKWLIDDISILANE